MNVSGIKQNLHNFLEKTDDKKLKAIYTLFEKDINEMVIEYDDELKKELDKRYLSYKAGKSKPISASESKKRINNILASGKN